MTSFFGCVLAVEKLKKKIKNNYRFLGHCKNSVKRCCVPSTQFSPGVTSYLAAVQRQNGETDIVKPRPYADFTRPLGFNCVYLKVTTSLHLDTTILVQDAILFPRMIIVVFLMLSFSNPFPTEQQEGSSKNIIR